MEGHGMSNFNIIVKQIIKKSLFTERQIEIITSIGGGPRTISRGAYYRQKGQAKQKAEALLYSMVLLYGLGILPRDSMRAAAEIADQVSVIFDSDIDETAAREVLSLVEQVVDRAMGK
jgi:hypothetical protein